MTEVINFESFKVIKVGKSGDLLGKKNDFRLKIGLIAFVHQPDKNLVKK